MLTKEDILSKYKANSLEDIKNINLWGNDLTNVDIISEMKNIEVVSLSLNQITSLKPFQNLQNLKELYLRKNNISNIREIDYLKQCLNLKILWIEENPLCEKNPNYQKEIIKELPQIIKLDNKAVNDILNEEDKKIEEKKEEEKKEEEKKEEENKEEEKKEEVKKIEEKKEEEKKEDNDLLNEMNNDLVNLQKTNVNKEVPVDKSIDNNLIQQILNQENIDSTIIPNINPNHNPNLNTNLNTNINTNLNTNINQFPDNSLVNNILKDIDTSTSFINKNKDKDNSRVNNILKDVDTSQTILNKKDMKDKEVENILKDIDTSTIFNKELPSIIKVEDQYPKNLDTIEQIRNYFNTPIHQPQKKKYDINMSNTLFTSNNKPPTPFDGKNPYRRPPSEEQYYNNFIDYRDQNRNKRNYDNRNYHFQNKYQIKAVLNLIEILSPTDLIHLRNDIIKRLKNQDY